MAITLSPLAALPFLTLAHLGFIPVLKLFYLAGIWNPTRALFK